MFIPIMSMGSFVPPPPSDAVSDSVIVYLFFVVAPIVCGSFELFCSVTFSVLSSLVMLLFRKKELVASLLLCCGYLCSVSLPHGAVSWSAVCSIFWSYSLTFFFDLSCIGYYIHSSLAILIV